MPGSANYGGEYWLYFPFSFLIFLKKVTWRCHDATMPGSANYGGARWGNEDPARGERWATGDASSESLWMAAGEEGGWASVDCRSRRRRRRVCGAPQEREVESLGRVTDHQRGRPWDYPWLPLMMGLPLTAAEDGTTPDCPLSMGHPPGALSTGRPPGALSIGHPPGALSMGRPPGFLSLGQTARVTCATGRSCFFFL